MEGVLDLDDPRCTRPGLAGAKAAALAAARDHGLPALPGVVVASGVAEPVLADATTALARGGSGQARLAIMRRELDAAMAGRLTTAAEALGNRLIVRSSADVEADGTWAGAFGSLAGVAPGELPRALQSCWASVFRPDTVERFAASAATVEGLRFAVLVQPEIAPIAGGTAHAHDDGTVDLVATSGPLAALMQGWDDGVRAHVDADGVVDGPGRDAFGADLLQRVARIARRTATQLDRHALEWALTDGEVVLLQTHRGRHAEPAVPPPGPVDALGTDLALGLAHLVRRFPGPDGERLVLAWAVADPQLPPPEATGQAPLPDEGLEAEAGALAALAWQRPPDRALARAAETLRELRGPRPGPALETLAHLRPVPRQRGVRLAAAVERRVGCATQYSSRADRRTGPDRWEPFIHGVVAAHGRRRPATPAAPGAGAGDVMVVRNPHTPPTPGVRPVIVARRPVPALAPLLWNSAGLITRTGGPGAHLFEVARSLGVPAVITPTVDGLVRGRPDPGLLAAVDGTTGAAFTVAHPHAPAGRGGPHPVPAHHGEEPA